MSGSADVRGVLGEAERLLGTLLPLLGQDARRVPNADLLDAVAALHRVRGMVEAAHLGVLREIDSRGVAGAAGSAPVATTTEGLVREVTRVSPGRARADVAAARATGPDGPLAGFGDRLARGGVNRGHVDVAVRCLDRVPRHLTRGDDGVVMGRIVSEFLLRVVDSHADERALDRHARQLLAHLAPDPTDRRDPDAQNRAFLDYSTDTTGMLVGRFQLDPVAGAALKAAIDQYSAPLPTDPVAVGAAAGRAAAGAGVGAGGVGGAAGRDERSPRQRRADALARLAELALGVTTPRRGERPRIVVHVTAEQLAGLDTDSGSSAAFDNGAAMTMSMATTMSSASGGATTATLESGEPIPAWVASRLACDAVLQRVIVSDTQGPLDVGREERLVTPAQRRALAARDRGCVICGAQPDWCDAHHVTPWSHGGLTDLANLALLCPGHHTAVHAGSWAFDRDPAGHLVLIPPRWVDPQRRPRRPTAHLLADAVRDIEQHLRDIAAAQPCPA